MRESPFSMWCNWMFLCTGRSCMMRWCICTAKQRKGKNTCATHGGWNKWSRMWESCGRSTGRKTKVVT
nr:MAG TPA: hypothetical protein [Caudoviricetes sp.]